MSDSLEKTAKKFIKIRDRKTILAIADKIKKSRSFDSPVGDVKTKKVKKARGMTLDEILAVIPKNIIANAKRDQVRITKLLSRGGKIYSESLTYDTSKRPVEVRKHKHYVEKFSQEDDGHEPFYKSRIKISCDCEFHTFWCEYALTTKGASWIKFSNGEFPVVRNPRNRPFACKHMYVLLNKIKKDKI